MLIHMLIILCAVARDLGHGPSHEAQGRPCVTATCCRLRPSAEQVTDDMDASHELIARHLTSTRPGRGKIIIQYVVLCAFVAAKKLPDSCVLAIHDRHEAIEDRDRSSAGGTGASCSLHTTRDNRAL